MKFTLDWLKEHLETTATPDEIARALTMIGLEVESVEDQGKALAPFIIAHVVSARPHPNADKLRVCEVDAGSGEILKVVCGAPNARTGMKSVFAFPGTHIPGKDLTIAKGVIRGEESNGMLCSAMELGIGEDHDGILDLPEDAPVGTPYPDYAGLHGIVFDIAITPNRGDCTGVRGVARDLAGRGVGRLKDGAVPPMPSPGGKGGVGVVLDFAPGAEVCKMFAGRLITGVRNGPSPDWLRHRLLAVGLRPINALVDVTNYIAHDRARPLHVFDADKLTGAVGARMARAGETVLALDGKSYALDETVCVIADEARALGIAGIMGGEETGCTEETVNVFVECAWFEPGPIAVAGRKLGIHSDARYRFERTVDPETVIPGIEAAARMIAELCGGVVHETEIAGHVADPGRTVDFPLSEVRRLTGLDLAPSEIEAALSGLGFGVTGEGARRTVTIPSWRPDIGGKADLVEEVMRMAGLDRVPVEPLPRLAHVAPRMLTTIQNRRRLSRRALAARGLDEAVTWSFIPHEEAARFGGGDEALQLANAIASDMTDMRPSLLPGLLSAVRRNAKRGFADLGLFEVGQVFLSDGPEGQHTHAAGIRSGTARLAGAGRHWSGEATSVGVFDAKADLAGLLDALGFDIEKLQLVPEPAPWSHPGRGGRLQLGPGKPLAWFGELHPGWAEELGIGVPVAAFEIDLDALPEPRRKPSRARPALALSPLQPVRRDFAFILERDVPASAVLRAARGADKKLIEEVSVFDVFEGGHIETGKKSLAIEVTLQPREKTLTEEEIETVSDAVVAAVAKSTGGVLRT